MRTVVYVLSPGHSGSTLLALLLGAHSRVATVGEVKVVASSYHGDEKCSCGAALSACAFWRRVNHGLHQRGLDLASPSFQLHRSRENELADRVILGQVRSTPAEWLRSLLVGAWPPLAAQWRRLAAANAALVDAVCETTGRPLFLDSSKDASRLRFLIESGAFDLKVLHLVRDGRAVAYSMIRKGSTPESAAREWVHEHGQARRLEQRWARPENWLRLRYETLCERPEETMQEVCRFIDVSYEPAMLEFREWESHVLGNRMRMSGDGRIALDTTWRAKIEPADLERVTAIAGAMNRAFGYA